MRIAKYISDLLFEYECVVIPGLGGFISNEIPAEINGNQHHFTPPSKKIVFNANLRVNDGLLINHIAKAENISYTDARFRVESFVRKCTTALDYGKRVNFHKIGWIYINHNGNTEFDPDTSQNYNPNAFGLSSFISPPIKREQNIRINKKFSDRKAASVNKKQNKKSAKKEGEPRYVSISLMPILIIAIVSSLFIFNFSTVKDLYHQYGSSVPFFYGPDEFVANNLDKIPYNSEIDTKSDVQTAYTEPAKTESEPITKKDEAANIDEEPNVPAENQLADNTEPDDKETVIDEPKTAMVESAGISLSDLTGSSTPEKQEPKRYFIIAGSFQDEENAQKLVDKLKAKGYGAEIVDQNKYGMYRVSFEGFIRKQDAEEALAAIRNEENPAAWLHKK